jgi:tRNA uridine 5-carbamoylmethylation protein Kti12
LDEKSFDGGSALQDDFRAHVPRRRYRYINKLKRPFDVLAIVTVGLPARGKTYLSHKLCRYLRWLGIPTSIFSIGDYRRRLIGRQMSHDYFNSEQTRATREKVADQALEELIAFIKHDGGQVGIYDGSNTEERRRQVVYERYTYFYNFDI